MDFYRIFLLLGFTIFLQGQPSRFKILEPQFEILKGMSKNWRLNRKDIETQLESIVEQAKELQFSAGELILLGGICREFLAIRWNNDRDDDQHDYGYKFGFLPKYGFGKKTAPLGFYANDISYSIFNNSQTKEHLFAVMDYYEPTLDFYSFERHIEGILNPLFEMHALQLAARISQDKYIQRLIAFILLANSIKGCGLCPMISFNRIEESFSELLTTHPQLEQIIQKQIIYRQLPLPHRKKISITENHLVLQLEKFVDKHTSSSLLPNKVFWPGRLSFLVLWEIGLGEKNIWQAAQFRGYLAQEFVNQLGLFPQHELLVSELKELIEFERKNGLAQVVLNPDAKELFVLLLQHNPQALKYFQANEEPILQFTKVQNSSNNPSLYWCDMQRIFDHAKEIIRNSEA